MVERSDVERAAENARLDIKDEEADELVEDFREIIEMFERIEEVDTEDVEPAFHPVEVEPESRKDREEDTLSPEEVFRNTGNEEDGKFKGPSA